MNLNVCLAFLGDRSYYCPIVFFLDSLFEVEYLNVFHHLNFPPLRLNTTTHQYLYRHILNQDGC
ncbi:MAG: hypothetical protein SWX82_09985 [Cyanobacteriota bacterium]|nr:hypothetical protein [Cyanobacteriota bacterium]